MSNEQREPQSFFELADPRTDVGLHSVEALCGARDRAVNRDLAKYLKRCQIQMSHGFSNSECKYHINSFFQMCNEV